MRAAVRAARQCIAVLCVMCKQHLHYNGKRHCWHPGRQGVAHVPLCQAVTERLSGRGRDRGRRTGRERGRQRGRERGRQREGMHGPSHIFLSPCQMMMQSSTTDGQPRVKRSHATVIASAKFTAAAAHYRLYAHYDIIYTVRTSHRMLTRQWPCLVVWCPSPLAVPEYAHNTCILQHMSPTPPHTHTMHTVCMHTVVWLLQKILAHTCAAAAAVQGTVTLLAS